jgi:DNA adenine methylase
MRNFHGNIVNGIAPHIVQYQGSKRILAPQILQYMPKSFNRMLEPFSGMAAMTVAVACERRASRYHINDLNGPLVALLDAVVNNPQKLIDAYKILWDEQFVYSDGHIQHFYKIREDFNSGNKNPERMLYLLARCVKGAVRYGNDGKFNQSPDNRRHGTSPVNIAKNAMAISSLLRGKVSFSASDYREVFDMAKVGDIVYMDPPYQGVTNVRDKRYFSGVPFDEFVSAIDSLNKRGIDFLISYDGECGGKEYGQELPKELGCKKILLNAGLSSQALLLGKKQITFEALYIGRGLLHFMDCIPIQPSLFEAAI